MKKYEQNLNRLHGILIKNSDMQYKLKELIARILRSGLDTHPSDTSLVCQFVTVKLEQEFPGSWIVIAGSNFTANIMHDPGYFMRASTQKHHYIIFRLKRPFITPEPELKAKRRLSSVNF